MTSGSSAHAVGCRRSRDRDRADPRRPDRRPRRRRTTADRPTRLACSATTYGAVVTATTSSRVASPSSSVRCSSPSTSRKTDGSVTTTSAAPSSSERIVRSRTTSARRRDDAAMIVTITRPSTDDEIHRPADAEHVLAGHGPVRDVAGTRSPASAPSTATSTWPPRIIAKLVALSKYAAPGSAVTGCLAASMRSGSARRRPAAAPRRSPFSVWRRTPESA